MSDFFLNVGIFAGGSVSFSGKTPQQRDLGGAEYCCVSMAEALAARGHTVTVFTPDSKAVYEDAMFVDVNGVRYYPMERAFKDVCHATQWDVFIVSREYPMLSNTLITSKLNVLWNHDILSDPDSFREHIHRADTIFCLSHYHKTQYLKQLTDEVTKKCTLKPEHITTTRNGVDLALIDEALNLNSTRITLEKGKYKQPTFIYSSRPERGLKYLLRDIWPNILNYIPDAQLKIACYNLDTENLPQHILDIHRECYDLLRRTPNVEFIGSLRRLELFQVIAACHAMIYPSIFPEVSCLSVLEAQALGTPVLTSNRGALVESNWSDEHIIFDWESVENGIDHGGWAWIQGFIEHYWYEEEVADRYNVQEDIKEFHDWKKIAEEWEQQFHTHFDQRSSNKPKRVIQNLIYNSDLLAANWALHNSMVDVNRPDTVEGQSIHGLPYEEWKPLRDQVAEHLQYHHAEPEVYSNTCGDLHENIYICPDRMKVALDLIQEKYGHEKPFTLLDIGVGAGRFLYHVLKNFHNCQVMGIDFSWQLCAQARKNLTDSFPSIGDDISFIQHGDIIEMNLDDFFGGLDRPDVVFCGEWLEHQTDLVQALTKVDACVKEGGLVIYTTPYGPWEAISFGDAHTKDGHEIRFHVSHFEYRDFADMFKDVYYNIEATYIQHSPLDYSIIGNYVTSYTKTDGTQFYTPDYHRKFITTRPYIRVAGFLITKDEEDNITRALKPLMKRVDNILVYDTGSKDRTVDLAEGMLPYTDMVVKGYWDDDFGAARNRALDIISHFENYDADYILWQDADEVLLNGYKLKHYLQGDLEVYDAFIITQNHLMIDMPISKDVPIRVYRNKPEYRFFGKLHEHVLDMRDPDGNTDLFPKYIIPDIKIAHYGYVTEDERRWKVIHRNYDILKAHIEAHPNHEIGKICLMRDYINHVRWNIEKHRPLTDKDLELLYDVIEKFQQFKDPTQERHFLARVFYQDALRILGEQHYPLPDGRLPIHASVVLVAKRGPFRAQEEFQPEMRWFKDADELRAYILRNAEKSCAFVERKPRLFED